jgi:phospholipase/carboxylesterase
MNQQITLSGPEQQAKSGNAKQLVILLHGLGADGSDLFGLVPYFADVLPDAHFIAPNAPFPCDLSPYGRQWFSLQIREEKAISDGLKIAEPILNNFIDSKLKELKLEDDKLGIIGFSQGTMLSLHTILRREKEIAGLLGYSGALVAPHLLKDELKSKPPICLVHGEDDQIVPFDAFTQAVSVLQKQGIQVHGYSREGLGHGIDPAGIQIGRKFLKEVL